MTEKIIIDDVDVKKCPCFYIDSYNEYSCDRDYSYGVKCKPKDRECNAYVKFVIEQLQRKTKECEELKQRLLQLSNESVDVCLMIKANDELQNKLQIATEALRRIRYNELEDFGMTEAEYKVNKYDTEFSVALDISAQALERIQE